MSITSMEDLKNKQAEVKKNLDGYTCRVLVCSGTGCIASGAQKIYEEMSRLCEGIEGVAVEMQKDVPHVGIVKTGCQGLCDLGPLMRIEPYDYQMGSTVQTSQEPLMISPLRPWSWKGKAAATMCL